MKIRLMTPYYRQNDDATCVTNVYFVLCKYPLNVDYLTYNVMESVEYICEARGLLYNNSIEAC
jgi:hypothetical protein